MLPAPPRATFAELSAWILARPTLTAALESWLLSRGRGRIGIDARILGSVGPKAATDPIRDALRLVEGEELFERRVALCQGETVLAEASNIFAPLRMPDEIAKALKTDAVPFGRLIAPLGGHRLHMSAEIEREGRLLVHRAVVCLGDGTRMAVVEERILPAALD
ncbi:MAG: hypothetical protein NW216_08310 [Hyphomicrobium sp.]|nr:hypothetical protein [Hyphomicrobium sp.]